MKYSKTFILCIVIFSFFGCAGVQSPLLSDQEHARLMESAGKDWDVSIGKDTIVLTSKMLCWFYIGVSLPQMEKDEFVSYVKESGRQDYYEIRLLFVPKWDAEKISAANKKNEKIREEIHQLPEKHGVAHLTRTKTNSYFPETSEDEKKVAAYDKAYAALTKKLIRLPDFQGERYSIFVNDNRTGFEAVWHEDLSSIDFNYIFPESL